VTQEDGYREMRDIWADYNTRQAFEHELINRKTTWLLATQTLLFAAYGVTFTSAGNDAHVDEFRRVVAYSGLSIALIVLVGVVALIRSKFRSWKAYRAFYVDSKTVDPPRPLDKGPLEWGVLTRNTFVTLLPDVLLPLVFVAAWSALARDSLAAFVGMVFLILGYEPSP